MDRGRCFQRPPVAPLLAISDPGCLAAGVNTAKRFEADVAPVFGACEEAYLLTPSPAADMG